MYEQETARMVVRVEPPAPENGRFVSRRIN
jgi:hypothetical protein